MKAKAAFQVLCFAPLLMIEGACTIEFPTATDSNYFQCVRASDCLDDYQCINGTCQHVCISEGITDCDQDCAGEWGGTATRDDCGVCDSESGNDNSTCVEDCTGEWGGTATRDDCGVCDDNPDNDCVQDCAGVWGGTATEDGCGVCDSESGNDNTTCSGFYVSTTGTDALGSGPPDNPFASIQYAIDASSSGDFVYVAAGTYTENINFNGKNISLIGENRETTIIDGNQSGSVVVVDSGENADALLRGFTIRNGSGTLDVDGHAFGGGIYIKDSSPTIEQLIVRNNVATAGDYDLGGGIYISGQMSRPTIENTTIKQNTGNTGGGIASMWGSSPTLNHVIISDNVAEDVAGGMKCNCSATLTHVLFAGNYAWSRGGGISVSSPDSNPTFTSVTITDNSVDQGIGAGAGAALENFSASSITNSIIYGNHPDEIWESTDEPPGVITISYSDIQGGWDGAGTNNIDADPLFCGANSDDYTLFDSSPAVGTGEGGATMGALPIGCVASDGGSEDCNDAPSTCEPCLFSADCGPCETCQDLTDGRMLSSLEGPCASPACACTNAREATVCNSPGSCPGTELCECTACFCTVVCE